VPSWRSTALEHQCREHRGAHAPADQHAGLVLHLPWRKRALGPAKPFSPLLVALAQRLGGERLAGDWLHFGVVLQPKRERVHAADQRHFVNGALQRGAAGGLAGRAHEQRRAGVDPHRLMRRGNRWAGIERMGSVGGRLDEVVERAGGGLGVVGQRRQRAVAAGAHPQCLPCRRAVPDGTEHLLAPQHQLHRASNQPGGHDAEDLRPGDQPLRTEAAAEERAADVNALRRDAEQPGDASLCHCHALARRVDGQGVAIPGRHDRVGLHRVVILRRRVIDRLHAKRRRREPGALPHLECSRVLTRCLT